MIIATLLAGAALQAAFPPPPPPAPPAPPAPPSLAAPPAPPLPPLPPIADRGQQVLSFDQDGQHVTIIKRREGDGRAMVTAHSNNVLTYKDEAGRSVTVFSDKPLTQADAERMERDMRAKIPEITAKAMADARAHAADRQIIIREARDEARAQGEAARKEGEKAREYAQVIVKKMQDEHGNWRFDGGPPSTMVFRRGDFPSEADIRELRDEVRALRAEMEELRAQLKSGPTH